MQEVKGVHAVMMEVKGEPNEACSDHLEDETQLDSRHASKVEKRDRPMLPLFNSRRRVIPRLTPTQLPLDSSVITCATFLALV